MKYLFFILIFLTSCVSSKYDEMREKFKNSAPKYEPIVQSPVTSIKMAEGNEKAKIYFEKVYSQKRPVVVLYQVREKETLTSKEVIFIDLKCQSILSYPKNYFPTWIDREAFSCRAFKNKGPKELLCTSGWMKNDKSLFVRTDYLIMNNEKECEKFKSKVSP